MAMTPKQERNGITGAAGGGGNVARPGPDATGEILALKGQSEAAADRRKQDTQGFIESPAGSGAAGLQIGGGGDMFVWDSGLAVSDVEGGGSG